MSKAKICEKFKQKNAVNQYKILRSIDHPFVNCLEECRQDEANLYYLTKFVKGGEVFRHLIQKRRLPENDVRFIAAQIACALDHLHKNDIIYRSLVPENVLIGEDGYI